MTKLILSFLGIAALAAFTFTSCKKSSVQEEIKLPPTITFSPAPVKAEVDNDTTKYDLSVTYHADQKLAKISVLRTYKKITTTVGKDMTAGFKSETQQTIIYHLAAEAEDTVTYKFIVLDKDGQTVSKTCKISVKPPVNGGNIKTYSGKLLGSQYNPNAGSFFSTVDGNVYNSADGKTNSFIIDFVCHYDTAINICTIAAPNDTNALKAHAGHTSLGSWTTHNATKFTTSTLSSSDFDAINSDTKIIAEAANAAATEETGLIEGKIYAFVTAAGKKGLFKVITITNYNKDNKLTASATAISIDVKVQK